MLKRRTEEEKAAEAEAAAAERAREEAENAEQRRRLEGHLETLPKFEYQVKRIGEDKQKGFAGSGRMEDIFNAEGKKGWELVAINEERATFKRRLPA